MHELRPGLWHWEARHPHWDRAVGPVGLVLRDRRRPTPAALRPVGAAGRARGPRGRPRDGDRAHGPMARARHAEPRGTDRRTGLRASAGHARRPHGDIRRLGRAGSRVRQPGCPLASGRSAAEARLYGAGDRLSIGVEAFPGQKRNDMVLWIESPNAVIAGDTLVDWGQGLQINPRWLRENMTREQVAGQLRSLLERPVEHVLPTHGGPTDWAALEHALS